VEGASRGNPGPCSWSAVVVGPSDSIKETSGFLGRSTRQAADIAAALKGLLMVPEGALVSLSCSTGTVRAGLGEWRRAWEQRAFKTVYGVDVANLSLWRQLFAEADKRIVRAVVLKAGAESAFQVRCADLAQMAMNQELDRQKLHFRPGSR
jgi:ribonuclease HI